ncbi:MAG: TraB/GumN family protein [Pseudomonadota bacterium]
MTDAFILAALLLTGIAVADEADTNTTSQGLEVVLVTGEQPGPALWKVSSRDHVLWILGEVAPQPDSMKWRSKRFEGLLAKSQEVILDFSGVMWPNKQQDEAETRVRRLPGGQTLKDVVPAGLYARVEAARKQYGTPKQIEELRPFYAARRILLSALRTMDMEKRFSATFAVKKLARRANVWVTSLQTPGQTHEEHLNNVEHGSTLPCLEMLVEMVEDGGTGLRRLANAWAVGDIDALRQLVPVYALQPDHHENKCSVALYGGEQRANEFVARRTEAWLGAAERALKENKSTMAVVQMAELFSPDGYLAGLRARGYQVVEPN